MRILKENNQYLRTLILVHVDKYREIFNRIKGKIFIYSLFDDSFSRTDCPGSVERWSINNNSKCNLSLSFYHPIFLEGLTQNTTYLSVAVVPDRSRTQVRNISTAVTMLVQQCKASVNIHPTLRSALYHNMQIPLQNRLHITHNFLQVCW